MTRSALDNRERLPITVTDGLHRSVKRLNQTIERQAATLADRDAEIVRLREWVGRFQWSAVTRNGALVMPVCPECGAYWKDRTGHNRTCRVPSLLSPSPQGASEK